MGSSFWRSPFLSFSLSLVLVPFLQPLLLGPLPFSQSLSLPPGSISISRPGNPRGSKLLREAALLMVLCRGENCEGDEKAEEDETDFAVHLCCERSSVALPMYSALIP